MRALLRCSSGLCSDPLWGIAPMPFGALLQCSSGRCSDALRGIAPMLLAALLRCSLGHCSNALRGIAPNAFGGIAPAFFGALLRCSSPFHEGKQTKLEPNSSHLELKQITNTARNVLVRCPQATSSAAPTAVSFASFRAEFWDIMCKESLRRPTSTWKRRLRVGRTQVDQ